MVSVMSSRVFATCLRRPGRRREPGMTTRQGGIWTGRGRAPAGGRGTLFTQRPAVFFLAVTWRFLAVSPVVQLPSSVQLQLNRAPCYRASEDWPYCHAALWAITAQCAILSRQPDARPTAAAFFALPRIKRVLLGTIGRSVMAVDTPPFCHITAHPSSLTSQL